MKITKSNAILFAVAALAVAALAALMLCMSGSGVVLAETNDAAVAAEEAAAAAPSLTSVGAAIAISLGALGGAIAMGMAIAKAMDGIARQPEADGKIRSTLMLGLVFIETVVIYALIVAILIMFVV